MATQVQFRRGTTAETAAFTGAVGEVTVDTVKRVTVVHDGAVAGGFPTLREDGVNSLLAAGSLASPALKFANSTNTGFYSPAAGTIALVTGGVAALTTDTAGNLTASGLFTASGRITGAAFVPTGSTVPANGLYLSAANTVAIATNSGARLTIGPTGDVTITGGLSIGSSFSATSFVPTGSSIPTNGMYLSAPNEISLATNGVQRFTISSTGVVSITGGFNFTGTYIADSFIPTSASIPTNGLYLPSANTLGLATDSALRLSIGPTGNISVVTGNITTSSGTNTAQSFIPTGSTIPVNGLYLPSANSVSIATNSSQRLAIDSTGNVTVSTGGLTVSAGSATAQSFIPSSSTVPVNGMYLSAANTIAFATNTTSRLTIGSTGNVTIGGTGTLTVPGSNTAASFIPTGSSIPANGMYLSAANTVAFATNSGQKLTLDSVGNLTVSSGNLTVSTGTAIASVVRMPGSSSGYTELAAPAVAGSNRLVLPTGNGSANQALITDGSGVLSWAAVGGLTLDTLVSSTSGSSVVFSGLPSTVKRITMMFNGVSTTGTSAPRIRIGDSGGTEATGYVGTVSSIFSSANPSNSIYSTGFLLTQTSNWTAAGIVYGSCVLTLIDPASNTWVINGSLSRPADTTVHVFSGSKSLSDVLTSIIVTTATAETFDAGSINILYE